MKYLVLSAAYHHGLVWCPFGGLIRICNGEARGGVAEEDGEDVFGDWASQHARLRNFVLEGDRMSFEKFYMDTRVVNNPDGDGGFDLNISVPEQQHWSTYEFRRQSNGLYLGLWNQPGAEHSVDRGGKAHARISELDLDIPLEDVIGIQDEQPDSAAA